MSRPNPLAAGPTGRRPDGGEGPALVRPLMPAAQFADRAPEAVRGDA